MTVVCGIDEAGRGPIIGPLVICGITIEQGKEQELIDLGVKDSKLLTPLQREKIAKVLEKKYKFKTVVIQPNEIDDAVSGKDSLNLNWLEAKKAIEIINGLEPDSVVLDCPSPNIKAYTNYILKDLKDKKTKLLCAHHADRDYPIVGAASIIAKVLRDKLVDNMKKKIGEDFGSGYVADPKTKKFLDKNWAKYPDIFRHSWTPYQTLVNSEKQKGLTEF